MIFAILGALAVVIFAVVAYLVARHRADAGLMAQMPGLKTPVAVMPIDVTSIAGAMDEARGWWNEALGQRVFMSSAQPTAATCVFVERGWGDEDFFARTTFVAEKMAVLILVNLREVDRFPQLLTRALAHELGHVLGLADDDDPASVMFRRVVTGPWHLLASDRALVEARL